MAEALGKKPPFRVSVRNFMTNRLMCRKQFNVEIEHPGRERRVQREKRPCSRGRLGKLHVLAEHLVVSGKGRNHVG
jgi:ribosomal protein S24E